MSAVSTAVRGSLPGVSGSVSAVWAQLCGVPCPGPLQRVTRLPSCLEHALVAHWSCWRVLLPGSCPRGLATCSGLGAIFSLETPPAFPYHRQSPLQRRFMSCMLASLKQRKEALPGLLRWNLRYATKCNQRRDVLPSLTCQAT